MGETKINLLPFVAEAMGYNQDIYADIDRLYQTHKYEFYKAATESEFYNHQIITEGGLLQEEYCKKALGILLSVSGNDDVGEMLFEILRKGWPYAYIFVENHAEIDLMEFMRNAIHKAGGLEKVSDDWLNSQMLVAYFLALNARKPVVENGALKTLLESLSGRWRHYNPYEPTRVSLKYAEPEMLERVKQLKGEIFAQYGRFTEYFGMYGKLRDLAETMAFIFDFENLSFPSIIEHTEFGEEDIEEILIAYLARNKVYEVKSAARFLCDAMYVKYMAKAYKDVKRRYFKYNRETMYVELEGIEKHLSEATQKIMGLSANLSKAGAENDALKKENDRLKCELIEEKRNRQELNGLREFLYSLDRRQEYSQAEEPYDLDELKNYRSVLIGGHEKWQQRMKELLPEFTFIRPENKSFDTRLLDGINTVFIYVNYLNHSIYERAMSAIAGTDKKVVYIDQQNDDKVLSTIYAAFKDDTGK